MPWIPPAEVPAPLRCRTWSNSFRANEESAPPVAVFVCRPVAHSARERRDGRPVLSDHRVTAEQLLETLIVVVAHRLGAAVEHLDRRTPVAVQVVVVLL